MEQQPFLNGSYWKFQETFQHKYRVSSCFFIGCGTYSYLLELKTSCKNEITNIHQSAGKRSGKII